MSIEDIYIKLLEFFKELAEELKKILKEIYKNKSKSELEKTKKEFVSKILKKTNYSISIEYANLIFLHIVQNAERYINEYKLKKSLNIQSPEDFKNMNPLLDSFSPILDNNLDWKRASDKTSIKEAIISLYKVYKREFILLTHIIRNLKTNVEEILNKYTYDRLSRKTIAINKKFGSKVIYPYYGKDLKYKFLIAIDTSGSISYDEYVLFANAILTLTEFFRNSDSILYMFSGNITNKVHLSKLDYRMVYDILRKRIGYGGTVIREVIEDLSKIRNLDQYILIILTDGYIFDIDTKDYYDVLSKLGKIIFITTENVPELIKKLNNAEVILLSPEESS